MKYRHHAEFHKIKISLLIISLSYLKEMTMEKWRMVKWAQVQKLY